MVVALNENQTITLKKANHLYLLKSEIFSECILHLFLPSHHQKH